MAVLENIPDKIFFPAEFDTSENRAEAVSVVGIAAVLASDLKEERSSVTVMLRNVSRSVSYCVTAQQDGRVCGSVGSYSGGVLKDGFILEIVQRAGSGKDYSSIVCGQSVEAVIDEYIVGSMQRKALISIYGNVAVLAEELPFTSCLEQGREALRILETDNTPEALKAENGFRFVSETELTYGCTCTKRSVRKALTAAVGAEDLDSMEDRIEVSCKLCGKKYIIEKSEL